MRPVTYYPALRCVLISAAAAEPSLTFLSRRRFERLWRQRTATRRSCCAAQPCIPSGARCNSVDDEDQLRRRQLPPPSCILRFH